MDAPSSSRGLHGPPRRRRRPNPAAKGPYAASRPEKSPTTALGQSGTPGIIRNASTVAATVHKLSPAPPIPVQAPPRPKTPIGVSQTRFSDFVTRGRVSQGLVSNIPHEFCTEVQATTIDTILDGVDVIARAKTGTGKTLAFLLPSIQRHLLEANPTHKQPSILVLSPTRELAIQIEKEARKVIGSNKWSSQIVVGGTNIKSEVRKLEQGCNILVATPGRLLDHIQNYGLNEKLQQLRCLVLDEADRLLDQGFRVELEKIAGYLPKDVTHPRQTLLFSATISPDVQRVAQLYMVPEHKYISTVKDTDESTHEHVKQEYMIIDAEWHLPLLAKFIADSAHSNPDSKIICFFSTARATGLAATTLKKLNLPVPIFEIHSRLSQSARTKATKEFTEARSAVLLSSDVTARGIDIPGISAVIQIGLPMNAEQYVHRLGRTARAGNSGSGFLILAPWEQRFLAHKDMINIPIQEMATKEEEMKKSLTLWRETVDKAMSGIDDKTRCAAYQAMLGYYASNLKLLGLGAPSLLLIVNQYAKTTLRWRLEVEGKTGLPPIKRKVAGKMPLPPQLKQSLNLVNELPWDE